MTYDCACGHVLDEHNRGAECLVDDCRCVHFEEADDDGLI